MKFISFLFFVLFCISSNAQVQTLPQRFQQIADAAQKGFSLILPSFRKKVRFEEDKSLAKPEVKLEGSEEYQLMNKRVSAFDWESFEKLEKAQEEGSLSLAELEVYSKLLAEYTRLEDQVGFKAKSSQDKPRKLSHNYQTPGMRMAMYPGSGQKGGGHVDPRAFQFYPHFQQPSSAAPAPTLPPYNRTITYCTQAEMARVRIQNQGKQPLAPPSRPIFDDTSSEEGGGNSRNVTPPPQQQQQAQSRPMLVQQPSQHVGNSNNFPPAYSEVRTQYPAMNTGTNNVHTPLNGHVSYHTYGGAEFGFMGFELPLYANFPVQNLPIFIQMFPTEFMERRSVMIQNIIDQILGKNKANTGYTREQSRTSFIINIETGVIWHLIYFLHKRVLMDRHGFWYARDQDEYEYMQQYCNGIRNLPQKVRHQRTEGLPCMPLVVELGRQVEPSFVMAPLAPPLFTVNNSSQNQ